MDAKPEADVIWWDVDTFRVRCPHCEGVHDHHHVNWNGAQTRVPHCGHPESYLCCFPINDEGQVAYEIDKKQARYVNICYSRDDIDELDSLSHEFASRAKVTVDDENDLSFDRDSEEMTTITGYDSELYEEKAIHVTIADCKDGNTEEVREYLECSPEAQLFLHGRDDEGNTTLTYAAMRKSSSMVSLLLEHGASVNAVNHRGRSPLMEAALWGRLDNAKLLLENAADKNLRDDGNRLAVDLARPTQRNRRDIYERIGGYTSLYSKKELQRPEDTFKRDFDRRSIVRLLGGEDRKSKNIFGTPPILSQYRDYFFKKSPMEGSIILHGPVTTYPVASRSKTVARLERGGKFESIVAMSGWSHGQWLPASVSGRQWTDEVLNISCLVDHTPACDSDRDQNCPGQYNACHAEKQLIAYFIDRHVFLSRDSEPDSKLEEDIESVGKQLKRLSGGSEGQQILNLESQLKDLKQQQANREKLARMSKAPPPASLSEAVILISSPVCADCLQFKNKVNQKLKLSLQLFAAC
ncbi:uncharacterized protein GIQ15_03384 [Arthroderma uncinatum]|uniref:uncharacterized protein n=1 Tax=Arthroderma uncinatum TaxID=74035 RepID=UPI00144AD002|nr:uncharacterized protein GIQ15_03384 [Arthroderma uncinatum]KAF3484060.1 hypothetical protein GIQ15_03384 [Arthroderma uncinatum]